MGLDEGFDVIVEMDADGSHQPEELPRLLEAAADHDVVIGSRYVDGGAVTNWSRARVTLSRGGNRYARTLLRLPLRDATSGFRAYRGACCASCSPRDLLGGLRVPGRAGLPGVAAGLLRGRGADHLPGTRARGLEDQPRIIAEAMLKVAGWAWRDRFRREP